MIRSHIHTHILKMTSSENWQLSEAVDIVWWNPGTLGWNHMLFATKVPNTLHLLRDLIRTWKICVSTTVQNLFAWKLLVQNSAFPPIDGFRGSYVDNLTGSQVDNLTVWKMRCTVSESEVRTTRFEVQSTNHELEQLCWSVCWSVCGSVSRCSEWVRSTNYKVRTKYQPRIDTIVLVCVLIGVLIVLW
jgi:hypothetical protein